MKKYASYIAFLFLCAGSQAHAQDLPGQTTDGNINVMDAAASVLGTVFTGDSLLGNKGSETTYLDILQMSDLSPAEKKRHAASYLFYSKTLDPKSKDSLDQAMIEELKGRFPKDSLSKMADSLRH